MTSQGDAGTESRRRPRVTVVTNGNFFAALGLESLLETHGADFDVEVWVTTGLRRRKTNRVREGLRLMRRWGLRYSVYKLFTTAAPYLVEFVTRRPVTVAGHCASIGIPCRFVRDVNARAVVDSIRAFAPDLLVSFSCPYRIGKTLLALPSVGSLNVHSSLLPAYAGVCTYIHVLADGRNATGITVHEMTEEFDAGRIVAQERIEIPGPTSVLSLFSRQCSTAAPLLLRSVREALDRRVIEGKAQDAALRSYHGEPTRSDIRRLRDQGHALLRWDDIARLTPGSGSRVREGNPAVAS